MAGREWFGCRLRSRHFDLVRCRCHLKVDRFEYLVDLDLSVDLTDHLCCLLNCLYHCYCLHCCWTERSLSLFRCRRDFDFRINFPGESQVLAAVRHHPTRALECREDTSIRSFHRSCSFSTKHTSHADESKSNAREIEAAKTTTIKLQTCSELMTSASLPLGKSLTSSTRFDFWFLLNKWSYLEAIGKYWRRTCISRYKLGWARTKQKWEKLKSRTRKSPSEEIGVATASCGFFLIDLSRDEYSGIAIKRVNELENRPNRRLRQTLLAPEHWLLFHFFFFAIVLLAHTKQAQTKRDRENRSSRAARTRLIKRNYFGSFYDWQRTTCTSQSWSNKSVNWLGRPLWRWTD